MLTKDRAWDAHSTNVGQKAGEGWQLAELKRARTKRFRWDTEICSEAASSGHFDVLICARRNGCRWDEDTCASAAAAGHLHILQWARAQACSWDSETCSEAAGRGHLDFLMWARHNGCPWHGNRGSGGTWPERLEIWNRGGQRTAREIMLRIIFRRCGHGNVILRDVEKNAALVLVMEVGDRQHISCCCSGDCVKLNVNGVGIYGMWCEKCVLTDTAAIILPCLD